MGELTSELLQFWGAAKFEDQSKKLTKSEEAFLEKEGNNPTPLPIIRTAMFKLMMLRAAAHYELNEQGRLNGQSRSVKCGIRLEIGEASLLHFDSNNVPMTRTDVRIAKRNILVMSEDVDECAARLPNSTLYDDIKNAKEDLNAMMITCHFL